MSHPTVLSEVELSLQISTNHITYNTRRIEFMRLRSSCFESKHIIGTGNILCDWFLLARYCGYAASLGTLLSDNSPDVIVRLAELPILRLPHRSVCMCTC